MANFVFVLIKGMDMTPGGKDESKVRGSACILPIIRQHLPFPFI